MTDSSTYRTNRDLFSNHYLGDHLRDTEPWNEVSDADVEAAYEEITDLWAEKQGRVDDYNEAQLERNFIRPIFDILGISFEIEETVMRNARRPDYGFFPSEDAADAAFDRENFYEEATAVADAKRWGRMLDTRGKEKRDFENPSYQIHRYLQETPTQWAVLTNGEKWRLYYGPTSHRLDSYYEIDLPELLDVVDTEDDLEAFKEFYLFFRQKAFLPDQTGDCFLDDVYDESSIFAEELGEDLQENIYEAIRVLAEGFLDTNDDLDDDDLDLIHDSSLIYLYRLIFVLYAESEGRDLLPTDNEIYSGSYSLNELKLEVVENRDATQQHYQTWQTDLWDQLNELFVLIDQGSRGKGIPKEDLYIPAYNGGLFRTDPDEDDSVESQFLSNHEAGDAYLAEVIELLTRHEASEGEGKVFVDYSSLDERNLGSIYEGLLEYKLDVADEPLTVDDGEYTPAGDGDNVTVEAGEVYLRTDDGERKATGSYYTPEYVVEYIVDETLGPLVSEIRADLMSQSADTTHGREGGFADKFAERIFDLTVLDPAMGSGHFPVNAVDYLARKIIDAQEKQDRQAMDAEDAEVRAPTTEEGELRDINWARRKVAQRCIYGVDVNPLATELAKVSLWLRTLAAEQPLAFLDHHLKTGNSLVGSDIEDVLSDGDDTETEDGQLTLQQSFDHTRQRAMEHVTDRFQDLLNIDNETLEDAKEMEAVYGDVRDDPLYKKLLAMANVHTASEFGLDVPGDADERMARALHSDAWENIKEQDWFNSAQAMAEDERFFHWELEFPMAFYDQNGARKMDAGFDAVIGNPPYGDILSKAEKQYCRERGRGFESERADIFTAFVALPSRVIRESATWSYIIPNTPLRGKQYEQFRIINSSRYSIREIVEFGDSYVFDEEVFTMVLTALNESPSETTNVNYLQGDSSSVYDDVLQFSVEPETSAPWRPIDHIEAKVTGLESTTNLEPEICTCHDAGIDYKISGQGWQNRGEGVKVSDLILYEGKKKSDNDHRYIGGGEISEYRISAKNKWLRHDYASFIEGDVTIQVYPEYTEVPEKIVTRQTSDTLVGAIDTDEYYTAKSVHTTLLNNPDYDLWYVLGLINSSLLRYVYEARSGEEGRSFPQVRIHELRDLPIRRILFDDDGEKPKIRSPEVYKHFQSENPSIGLNQITPLNETGKPSQHDFIVFASKQISDWKEQRAAINVNLLDYLGNYQEGQHLPDIGIIQPSNPEFLDNTAEEYENLRVGHVRTDRNGDIVTVEATARYKPEDVDEFEVDQWGYTETDFETAFSLTGLNEEEAALVEAFVPVAVNKAGGFAGFRENATKTYSLLDRLKKITLPNINDVKNDLRRYVENYERANKLDAKIKKTNALIDKIVYDLYDLTDEEVEIVEEAVTDN